MRHPARLACVLLPLATALAPAQAPPLPPGDNQPLLRLEAKGPTALVTSLAFSADGKTLYAGGFDKVVRGWRLDLTTNHLYTTAPGTDRILKNLKEPINLYFFYSEKPASQAPDLATYAVRVREFLEEEVEPRLAPRRKALGLKSEVKV